MICAIDRHLKNPVMVQIAKEKKGYSAEYYFRYVHILGQALWGIAPLRLVHFSGSWGLGRSAPPRADGTVSNHARWPASTFGPARPSETVTARGGLGLPAGSDVTFYPAAEVRKSYSNVKCESWINVQHIVGFCEFYFSFYCLKMFGLFFLIATLWFSSFEGKKF